MKVSVILPAAGLGTRMKAGAADHSGISRKQFMLLDGEPIVLHTIAKFAACPEVDEVVLAVRAIAERPGLTLGLEPVLFAG